MEALLTRKNFVQVEQAANALATCSEMTGEECLVRDLLANLMHWCHAHQVDFDHELSMATDYFSEESSGG
jgi:hypothetical protein